MLTIGKDENGDRNSPYYCDISLNSKLMQNKKLKICKWETQRIN
jgi:hypothetical protein